MTSAPPPASGQVVRVRVLGAAELTIGETRIGPEAMVLFAVALYLALHAGQRVPRAQLLDVFWPGTNENSARHALRQLMYRLRRMGLCLALDGDELLLDASAVDSDVRDVLQPDWPDRADAEAVLAAEPLLPGYAPPMPQLYVDWLDATRAHVVAQVRRAMQRQIADGRREGRWGDVDDWSRRCLAIDPLNEEATLARAEAMAMSGSKAGALKLLDDYLWELGDRSKVIGLPAKLLRRRISEQGTERRNSRPPDVPLIGRAEEVARLNEVLAGTLDGVSTAILVEGAPGIGKTSVVRELVAGAAMRGWSSVEARLHPSDAYRPLSVFVELFTVLLRANGALGAAPSSIMQLKRLTELDVHDEELDKKSQEAEAVQARIRAAAVDLLGAVSSEGPLIVVLEDLHWIDEASIRLLQYIVEQTRAMPLFWLMTARDEGRLLALRAEISEQSISSLRLRPLCAAHAVALFRAYAEEGAHCTEVDLEPVAYETTGGNPLFIREIAREYWRVECAALPDSIRLLIRERVSRLSGLAQHVLHACAVLARYATVGRVVRVLEVGTSQLLACIDELDALGILGAGRDSGALSMHDLWQEEMLASVNPASKRLLHYRCGLVLEDECRGSRAATIVSEVARHYVAAGANNRALTLLEESAQYLLANGMSVDAAHAYALAFDAAITDKDRFRVIAGQIAALKSAGKWTEISRIIGQALSLERSCSDTHYPHTDLELIEIESHTFVGSEWARCLQRALACVYDESADVQHRAVAGVIAARLASNLVDLGHLRGLNELAETKLMQDAPTCALAIRIIYHADVGSLDAAADLARSYIRQERTLGSVRGLAHALRFASTPLRCLGLTDEARSVAKEAFDVAERAQLVGEAIEAAQILAHIAIDVGDTPTAKVWLERMNRWGAHGTGEYLTFAPKYVAARVALIENRAVDALAIVGTDVHEAARDELVRRRLCRLSVQAIAFTMQGDRNALETTLPVLRSLLDVTAGLTRQDLFVWALVDGLAHLGRGDDAREFAHEYVRVHRRERSLLLHELQRFLQPSAPGSAH